MAPNHARAGAQWRRDEDGLLKTPGAVPLAGDARAQASQHVSFAAPRFSINQNRSAVRARADGGHRLTASREGRLMDADDIDLRSLPWIAHDRTVKWVADGG